MAACLAVGQQTRVSEAFSDCVFFLLSKPPGNLHGASELRVGLFIARHGEML
jgi:hypothetical protein